MKQTRWRKLGRLYRSEGDAPWRITHASCPLVHTVEGDIYRVWFAPRDSQNRTYCAWAEFDVTRPNEILRHAPAPSVAPGEIGAFDESGAMFSWWLRYGGREYVYYTGWNVGGAVPFRNAIGVAISDGVDAPFIKVPGPVLDRSPIDPYFVGNPCVVVVGKDWHLWYLTGTAWHERAGGEPYADYNIRHARSADGVNWTPSPEICIDYEHDREMAIARPSVHYDDGLFRMWYSYRGIGFPYRLGYAESKDGVTWRRRDDLIDLPPSADGWDREMICYPYVFRHDGRVYMIYCGNGFSQGGIGLAVLED